MLNIARSTGWILTLPLPIFYYQDMNTRKHEWLMCYEFFIWNEYFWAVRHHWDVDTLTPTCGPVADLAPLKPHSWPDQQSCLEDISQTVSDWHSPDLLLLLLASPWTQAQKKMLSKWPLTKHLFRLTVKILVTLEHGWTIGRLFLELESALGPK